MKIEIKNRFTNTVIFTAEVADDDAFPIRAAVKLAVAARINLGGAYLGDAYLRGADLGGADLGGAYLRGAYLGGAYLGDADLGGADLGGADLGDADLGGADLGGADLGGADLGGADLGGAYLRGAYLGGAYLGDANLGGAYLGDAYLRGAYLGGAYLRGAYLGDADLGDADLGGADLGDADLGGAENVPPGIEKADPPEPYVRAVTDEQRKERDAKRMARFRERHPEVPVIEALDRKILDAVTSIGKLDMSQWHSCETTHCRAGWAITLAGEAGKKLEQEHGPHRAGAMIYRASTGRVPHFFATNEHAMEDIKRCAEEQR